MQSNLWLAQMTVPDMVEKGGGIGDVHLLHRRVQTLRDAGHLRHVELALIGLVRNLAAEFGPRGVRFNAICPGLVRTDFARELWDNPRSRRGSRTTSRCAVWANRRISRGLRCSSHRTPADT